MNGAGTRQGVVQILIKQIMSVDNKIRNLEIIEKRHK